MKVVENKLLKPKPYKRKTITKIVCDMCGAESLPKKNSHYGEAPDFDDTVGMYDVNNLEIKWEVGKSYPGDYWIDERYTVDLCIECRPKFFEKLEEIGINVNKVEDPDY